MQDTVPLIRTYLAVVETGSLTLAAKVVDRTLAAVSYQITRLEKSLGKKLFVRSVKGMVLSEDGQNFLPQALSLLHVYDQVTRQSSSPFPPYEALFRKTAENAQSWNSVPRKRINTFEDNLETPLLRSLFSAWKSYRADGKTPLLEDLINMGLISLETDIVILIDSEQSHSRIVAASKEPTRLFQLDKYGFGIDFDEIWKSPKLSAARRKIFSICSHADLPVFFSGNAPIPWHLDEYTNTIDEFVETRLDRLLLPIKINSNVGHHLGILLIAELQGRLSEDIPTVSGRSAEEQAASINFIGNISIAS